MQIPIVPLVVVSIVFLVIFILLRVKRRRVTIMEPAFSTPKKQADTLLSAGDGSGESNKTGNTIFQFGGIQSIAMFLIGRNPTSSSSSSASASSSSSPSVSMPSSSSSPSHMTPPCTAPWLNHFVATMLSSRHFISSLEQQLNSVLQTRADALEASGLAHTVEASIRLLGQNPTKNDDDSSDEDNAEGDVDYSRRSSGDLLLRRLPLRLHSIQVLNDASSIQQQKPSSSSSPAFKLTLAIEFAIGDVEAPSSRADDGESAVEQSSMKRRRSVVHPPQQFDVSFELSAHIAVAFGRFLPVTVSVRDFWTSIIKVRLTVEAAPVVVAAPVKTPPPVHQQPFSLALASSSSHVALNASTTLPKGHGAAARPMTGSSASNPNNSRNHTPAASGVRSPFSSTPTPIMDTQQKNRQPLSPHLLPLAASATPLAFSSSAGSTNVVADSPMPPFMVAPPPPPAVVAATAKATSSRSGTPLRTISPDRRAVAAASSGSLAAAAALSANHARAGGGNNNSPFTSGLVGSFSSSSSSSSSASFPEREGAGNDDKAALAADQQQQQQQEAVSFFPKSTIPTRVKVSGTVERVGHTEFEMRTCLGAPGSLVSLRDWWLLSWLVERQVGTFLNTVVAGRTAATTSKPGVDTPNASSPLFSFETVLPAQ